MYSKYIMLYSSYQGGIFYKSFTYKKTAKRNTYIQRIEHSSSEKAFSCFLSFDKTIKLRTHWSQKASVSWVSAWIFITLVRALIILKFVNAIYAWVLRLERVYQQIKGRFMVNKKNFKRIWTIIRLTWATDSTKNKRKFNWL